MMILKVKDKNKVVKSYKLYKRRHISIGRWRNNHVIIDDPTVSGHHARIDSDDGEFFVLNDLDSRNGTYLNGKAVISEEVKNGDLITIGNCTITYQHEDLEKKLDKHEAKKNPKTVIIEPKS